MAVATPAPASAAALSHRRDLGAPLAAVELVVAWDPLVLEDTAAWTLDWSWTLPTALRGVPMPANMTRLFVIGDSASKCEIDANFANVTFRCPKRGYENVKSYFAA